LHTNKQTVTIRNAFDKIFGGEMMYSPESSGVSSPFQALTKTVLPTLGTFCITIRHFLVSQTNFLQRKVAEIAKFRRDFSLRYSAFFASLRLCFVVSVFPTLGKIALMRFELRGEG